MIFHGLPAGLTVLCLASLAQTQSVCFFPNGYQSDDVPCDPSAGASMCCNSTAACLASGLCKDMTTNSTSAKKFIRATCTDRSWSSNQCPQYCLPSQGLNGTGFNLNLSQNDVHIRQCDVQGFEPTARFCCGVAGEQSPCCDRPSALFRLSTVPSPNDPVTNPQGSSPSSISSSSSSSSSSVRPSSVAGPSSSSSTAPAPPPPPAPSASSSSSLNLASLTPSPQTPLISPTSTSTATSGTGDTTAPSTDPPTSASSSSAPASSTSSSVQSPSRPSTTPIARASAFPTALAELTPPPSSSAAGSPGSGSGSSTSFSLGSSAHKSTRLSTGSVVGIGLGASVAGAGLVAISVYLLARRRLYKKQQKRWKEQVTRRAQQGSPDLGPGDVAVASVQGADGKPATVMLARQAAWASDGALPSLRTAGAGMYAESIGGPSPASMYLREMGWDSSTVASSEYSGQETRRPSEVDGSPVAERGGRTVTWLGNHSIYEMA